MKGWLPPLIGTGLTAGAAILAFGVFADRQGGPQPSIGVVAEGKAVYEAHCAACHGSELEGQPDWQSPLPSGSLPAPPHDASGHTWHHSDAVLFQIVKEGTAAVVGNGYQSDMPGFGDLLTDAEIQAVITYIKSTWPERERDYQAQIPQVE